MTSDDASVRARGVKLLVDQIRMIEQMGGTALAAS